MNGLNCVSCVLSVLLENFCSLKFSSDFIRQSVINTFEDRSAIVSESWSSIIYSYLSSTILKLNINATINLNIIYELFFSCFFKRIVLKIKGSNNNDCLIKFEEMIL
jgi:hypothetical protein